MSYVQGMAGWRGDATVVRVVLWHPPDRKLPRLVMGPWELGICGEFCLQILCCRAKGRIS